MSFAKSVLEQLIARKSGFSLPQKFYTDPEIFDLEMELIFAKDWLAVAQACEVPKAGDYVTVQIGKDSILIVRNKEGNISAFFNTCRHRGSVLCTKAKGSTPKIVCPYHQWTYELNGQLIFAREMASDFNKDDFPLHKVNVEVAGGTIYVCLSEEPPKFSDYARTIEPYITPHGMDDLKVVAEVSIVEQGNWKLVWENNRECYHCQVGHPALLRSLPESDDPNDPVTTPDAKAHMESAFVNWEKNSLPYSAVNVDGWRISRMPLQKGTVSMTMDGQPAVKNHRLGTLPNIDVGTLRHLHLPNVWLHYQADHCISFRVLPLSAQETQLTTKWMVPKDAVEGIDYDLDNLTKVWRETNDEDRSFVERNQLGINSRAYRPGPYSPTAEFGVKRFTDWYSNAMAKQIV